MKKGFTLLELMVAVFITSIVVIAAYSLMTGSTSSFQDEQERRMLDANLRNAELLIQRDLSRVGYRVPFDSNEVKEAPEGKYIGDSGERFQTFFLYKNASAKMELYEGQYIRFSGFTVVSNFTDFDGFQVESSTGTTLNINPALSLALTASDIGLLSSTSQPSMQTSSAAAFDAAFKRAFKHALAVHVASSTYEWVIVKLNGYTPTGNANSGTTQTTDEDGNQIAQEEASDNYTLTVAQNAPSELGFNGSYNNTLVNPIVAVSYKVVANGTSYKKDANNSISNFDLVRCYNKNIISPTLNANDLSDCQVLLHNIVYFDLYPMYPDNETSVKTYFNDVYNVSSINVANAPGFTDTSIDHWNQNTSKELRGFYYRIGVAGDKIAKTRFGENSSDVGPYNQVAFTKDGRPVMHLQGTAVIKTKNTALGSSEARIMNDGGQS